MKARSGFMPPVPKLPINGIDIIPKRKQEEGQQRNVMDTEFKMRFALLASGRPRPMTMTMGWARAEKKRAQPIVIVAGLGLPHAMRETALGHHERSLRSRSTDAKTPSTNKTTAPSPTEGTSIRMMSASDYVQRLAISVNNTL
jgi:hypothetical protein